MLYWEDEEGKRCFHPKIIDFMQKARHDKLAPILRDVDIKTAIDHSGSTLLHRSAEYGSKYLTTFFIKVAKIKVDAQNEHGATALMLASRNMNFEQVAVLLNAGADVCLKDNNAVSSLMIAENHRDVEALLSPFVQHIRKICKSNAEIADLLMRAGCEAPYRFEAFRNAEITKIMLERGCPPNARDKQHNGNSALHTALENNDLDSVKVLLQFGADKLIENRSRCIPFVHAFGRPRVDFEIFELLMPEDLDWTEIKAGSQKMKLYPIFVSATKRTLHLFLRRCSVDFNARDRHGHTPIHYLVENEHQAVWDLLEDVDFDVNARDKLASTALHLACTLINVDAVKFLLGRGADVNALNDMGRSPLHNVFINGGILHLQAAKYHECIELLLHYGADVQIIDRNRESLIWHSLQLQSYDLHLPILAHLVLLEAVGAPINRLVKNPIMIDVELRKAYEACKRQLELMKKSELYGSLTYFQLLTAENHEIHKYAIIEDVQRSLRQTSLDNYYIKLLRKRLSRAVAGRLA